MKALTTALIGTGAGAVVLLAYLSLGQQAETKKDVAADKARIEVERAKFDRQFDQAWAAFDGQTLSQKQQDAHDQRIQEAEQALAEARGALSAAGEASERDLAEIKAAIDSVDQQR
ncbi:MAG: hypothetical protein WC165_10925 [Dysgonamonadaceae bacterium]